MLPHPLITRLRLLRRRVVVTWRENLGLMLRDEFLFLALACLEEIDSISVILVISIMFTILKGLEIFSRPYIPQESLSFFSCLTCFGVTVKLFMSKSYYDIS